jgi:hypothetical protein
MATGRSASWSTRAAGRSNARRWQRSPAARPAIRPLVSSLLRELWVGLVPLDVRGHDLSQQQRPSQGTSARQTPSSSCSTKSRRSGGKDNLIPPEDPHRTYAQANFIAEHLG